MRDPTNGWAARTIRAHPSFPYVVPSGKYCLMITLRPNPDLTNFSFSNTDTRSPGWEH